MPNLSPEERPTDESVRDLCEAAEAWEPSARLVGNVTAREVAALAREVQAHRARLAQPEAEREGLRVDLSMWSDETKRAIYYALHRDPACVPRSTAHGSGANPIAPPPDGRAG